MSLLKKVFGHLGIEGFENTLLVFIIVAGQDASMAGLEAFDLCSALPTGWCWRGYGSVTPQ